MSETAEKERQDGESMTHRALGAMFWMVSGSGLQAVLRIVVLVVLARLLTPQDFGVVAAALILVDFMEIFSDFGMGPAIVQAPRLEERHVRTAFTLSVLLGCVFAALIWLAAPLAARFFRAEGIVPVLRTMALVFPLDSLSLVASSLLRRELQFRKITKITVSSYAAGYGVVGISMAFMGFGVWALVAANLAQTLIVSAALLAARPHVMRPLLDGRTIREMTFMGGGYSAAQIFNYVALKGDNMVVGHWLGTGALGLYTRAYGLMTMSVTIFGSALDKVMFASMSKVQGDDRRLARAYRRSAALVALLVLPLSTVMVVLAPELVHVLLGPKWAEVVGPFRVLALGMLFRTSYKLGASVARAKGAVYRNASRQALYALLVVGGAWVGSGWGLVGVSWGVLGALAVHFVLMSRLGLGLTALGGREYVAAHLPSVRLAALLGLELWAVAATLRSFGTPPVVTLAASLLVAGAMMLALLRLRPRLVLGEDGVWVVEKVAERLPGSKAALGWLLKRETGKLAGAA